MRKWKVLTIFMYKFAPFFQFYTNMILRDGCNLYKHLWSTVISWMQISFKLEKKSRQIAGFRENSHVGMYNFNFYIE